MPILSNEAMASQWKHSLISCVYLRSGRPNCTLNAVASRSGQNIFPVSSHGNYSPSLSCLVLSVFLCISSCRAKVCVVLEFPKWGQITASKRSSPRMWMRTPTLHNSTSQVESSSQVPGIIFRSCPMPSPGSLSVCSQGFANYRHVR